MSARRGSTLLETMIAGAVLVLGMVGIIQLLISGMSQFSSTNGRATGQDLAAAGIAEAMVLPFDAVAIGVSDAGIIFDATNRRFGRIRTVTAAGDGGVRARQIVVQTDWLDNLGSLTVPRTAVATAFISEVPDGSF